MSEEHQANECGCYRMRGNTFDATKYINTHRIFTILVPLESGHKALSDGAKIIKIRWVLIYFVASKESLAFGSIRIR